MSKACRIISTCMNLAHKFVAASYATLLISFATFFLLGPPGQAILSTRAIVDDENQPNRYASVYAWSFHIFTILLSQLLSSQLFVLIKIPGCIATAFSITALDVYFVRDHPSDHSLIFLRPFRCMPTKLSFHRLPENFTNLAEQEGVPKSCKP
jgi:hypothetical protein